MVTSSSGLPVLPKPVHLVLGESGAGCVQAACDLHGMPGTVITIAEDLAQGPLDDCRARVIAKTRAHAVVLWSAGNVGDAVFVAMTCEELGGRPEPLFRVEVSEAFVAMVAPQRLAHLYSTRRRMSASQRHAQGLDFMRMRERCGPLRRLELGRVVGAPMDYYDPLLMAACSPEWRTQGQVLGLAMCHCDPPNLLGDLFFQARLDHLIGSGRIEAKGPRQALHDCLVRLIPASPLWSVQP